MLYSQVTFVCVFGIPVSGMVKSVPNLWTAFIGQSQGLFPTSQSVVVTLHTVRLNNKK